MTVQVFEGVIKKKYRYVELYYKVDDKKDSLKCFVTDQYAWFNEVAGLTTFAAKQLENHWIIDPSQSCGHDFSKKAIALILGPVASLKLRNKKENYICAGNLLFEPYQTGNGTGYVYSGLLPKHLNNLIYS